MRTPGVIVASRIDGSAAPRARVRVASRTITNRLNSLAHGRQVSDNGVGVGGPTRDTGRAGPHDSSGRPRTRLMAWPGQLSSTSPTMVLRRRSPRPGGSFGGRRHRHIYSSRCHEMLTGCRAGPHAVVRRATTARYPPPRRRAHRGHALRADRPRPVARPAAGRFRRWVEANRKRVETARRDDRRARRAQPRASAGAPAGAPHARIPIASPGFAFGLVSGSFRRGRNSFVQFRAETPCSYR